MANNNNNTAIKSEAPKKKRSIGRWFKELFSELKKVSWPSFATVVKQTLVVLVVTAIFLVILMGMDAGLGALYKLLMQGLTSGTEEAVAASFHAVSAFSPIIGGLL